jgi:urease accessory protein
VTTGSSIEPLLALLQLSDSAIPIGGYSNSFGLETFVQHNTISDARSAEEAIRLLLSRSVAPQDGIACGLALRFCLSNEWEQLLKLNQYLTASKWSKEIYLASVRMGTRLLKLAIETGFITTKPDLNATIALITTGTDPSRRSPEWHHSVVFGFLAASSGLTERLTIAAYLQNSVNCLISACVRLIPLGHTDGQRILVSLRPLIAELAEQCGGRKMDEISAFAPLTEAASFAHESLYSRLFQS